MTLLLVKYSDTPKSAYGVVFRTITIFLLLSSILLGEGLVCIIFMAPMFYAVAGIIVFIYEYLKKKNKTNLNVFILIPVLFAMAQGHEITKAPQVLKVSTKLTIDETHDLTNLNRSPNMLKNLPDFFKIGFPKPISLEGKGTEVGDFRKITFLSNTKGAGILHLEIKEKTENSITFKVVEDQTHIDHWLTWEEINVKIKNEETGRSVVWTSNFRCDLGPSWYFEPVEKYGVKLMNEHLINSFFTD